MAAQMAVNSGASLWGPLKELWETVDGAVLRRQPESVHLLDLQLKKHKPHFLSLFKNPPKSAEQREKVRKASTEGIAIQGQQGSRLLPEQLLTEAFILSDLFDIGELAALELLLAGEQQQPYFPGLTRGLVAVLLYWDGKLCMANSLRTLIQSRQGKTFTLDLSGELVALTTRFTDELMSQGLTKRILTLVSEISVTREFERLQKERGLGNEKHRKEVADLIKECRQALADSLFSWTCQSPLSKDDTLALIGHLETVTAQADGSLDSVSLALVMALLYCLDVSFIEQGTEDRDDLLQALPLLTERQYVSAVHSRLMDSQPWKLPGLQAVCRLAWALLLRVLSQLPQGSALVEFTEADEALADQALLGDVFLFMKEGILGCESFSQEEFYIRRVHSLITDFLALMPMKVKQLRNRADEDARLVHMSLQMDSELPSSLRKDLDHLMILIGEFYSKDPFGLELGLEFWCPTESLQHSSLQGSYLGMALQRPPHKQVVLSKFVRQMGDLLPSTLYISYLRMLKGLANGPQCAHYCFSLLKTNGAAHSDNIQGVSGSPVSWEHFFHSLMLYHENLRRDLPNPDSAHYRHPPLRGITQREMEGLTSFLQLLTTIITWSENARLALCEHPQWTPAVVMLGLLQCSVPPVLKAELLHCLAAFGKSPEIAASLWQSLEYTQILQTVRAPGQRQAAGIEVELNEIESSCEEYPLTRSFCHLISTLVEGSLPVNLGAGLRVPGFQPYLNFLRDSVFLPFPTRAYRRPAEKWEVADSVLEVFHKLLRDYEPQPSDFVQEIVELQGEQVPAHKPPGHSIMFHLLNDSPMLALCLSLLEEGVRQLDTYAPFPGKKHLQSAVLHCLCLLDLALQKEAVFMDLLRESQASLLVSPLEQLLQGVSPQTRRADHIVNIARYLYHSSSNPEAAFQSAKILRRIANYPNIQIRLVGDFTHDQAVSDKLMAGFVECLDNEDAEEGTEKDDVDSQKKVARIRHETQIHILNLLITSLELKAPNLALYLLGYEVKKPVSSTNLQDPGVLGCPRSCLHAILSRLQRGTEKRSGPALTQQAPHLAELCYQVIYQLCACPDTSGPTMRYLRTSQDFLFSHLQHLPFILPSNQIAALSQMSWLMKTAAIELRVTSLNRQRSHTQRLVSLLLDDQPHAQHADGESGMEDETRSVSGFLHFDTVSKVRRKLLSVLDAIEFSQDMPELLQLDFFERTQIEQVISNCEHVNEQGHTVCNVKLLHRVLVAEVNALQGMAAIGQRPLLMEEVNSILQQVVERNRVRRSLSAKRHALQSWRSLVETLLTACPADLIPADERQLIIRDLLLDLHDKVLSEDAAGELMPIVAGAVFTLTAHLSQSVLSEQQQGVGLEASSGFASIANSALHLILRKLLDFILSTGGGYQRLRAHLYGSLLYYLQIAQKPEEPDTLQTGKAMWERLTAPEDGFSKLQRENLAIIESYGKALMEVVCRDACDGHEISRMLAMAVLDRILSIDRQNQWLLYICNSGYLRSLVESLRQDDVALQSLLTPQPPLLKPLYIFESKMALLTRVAKTGQGAVELLRCGLVAQLMECQVFDMVPDSDAHRVMRDPSGFIPSPMDRYRQILLPTLRLFQVILTSTSINHQQGAAQVLQWLIVHADTIQSLLRCQELSMGALQELSLLTGIISKTALPGALEMGGEVNSAALMEFQGHINRFQRLCLSLLGRLAGSERDRLLKQAEISAPGDSAERREEMEVAMQQVCANIMEYCQALLLQSSAQAQFSICLFSPSGSEPAGRDGARTDLSSTVPSMAYSRVPSLGLVLYLLKNSAADFFRFHQSHRQSLGKLQSLDQLPPEELKELCQGLVSGPGAVEKISSVQRSLLAKRRLVQLINNRAKLLALCSYVIETCLFVLWRHLEYYLLHCIPTDPKDSLLPGSTLYRSRLADDSFSGLQASGGRGLSLSRVSQQDLDLLKSDMAAGFGEALQRKLLEVEGLYSQVRSRYTFIQALVRRIRGLLRQPKS
ncbi:nuclear pore complex protein Nup205 isoform X4 [Maylandia zebra]|uniref:nuclear pore complex protein Nup205 isoform X4 n=1 Tax=Maylandia zebra TaxID=106582 RepID=UPI000645E8F3|nr:nuclear pore complex protein Nup205 isoform X4 [Maylandia zebra]XP_026032437.1 nuclear pore complex protein Nup205 isoform X4 [Astatotilapia calliptera]